MSIRVRAYRQSDAAALVSLSQTAVSPQQFHRNIAAKERAWVIEKNGRAVGLGAIDPVPGLDGVVSLEGRILFHHRRQGYGAVLLRTIVAELKEGTVGGTPIKQISYRVPEIHLPDAYFLTTQGFEIEHTEITLQRDLTTTLPHFNRRKDLTLTLFNHADTIAHLPLLYTRSFSKSRWYQPYTTDELQQIIQPSDELWVLRDENEQIGFAWLHFPQPAQVEIEPIGIMLGRQGQRYGSYLLNWLLHDMQQRGKTAVYLTAWQSNQAALSIYKSFDFVETGKTIYLALSL